MDGAYFARRVTFVVAATALAPAIIVLIIMGVGSLSESLAYMVGFLGLSILFASFPLSALVLIVLLVRLAMPRARSLGFPSWAGIAVPLIFVADWTYLSAPRFMPGHILPTPFLPGLHFPVFSILALMTLVVMAVAREPSATRLPLWSRYGLFGKVTIGAVGLVSAVAAVSLAIRFGVGTELNRLFAVNVAIRTRNLLHPLQYPVWGVLFCVLALSVLELSARWLDRGSEPRSRPDQSEPAGGTIASPATPGPVIFGKKQATAANRTLSAPNQSPPATPAWTRKLIWILPVAVAFSIGPLLVGRTVYPSPQLRYRLAIEVSVDGQVYRGSGVIGVTYLFEFA
ncbi:MAG: hypothetical protein IT535_09000 [Bauldia sp.]|nr:hypothetical protein [Bauldia sp.]